MNNHQYSTTEPSAFGSIWYTLYCGDSVVKHVLGEIPTHEEDEFTWECPKCKKRKVVYAKFHKPWRA